MESPLDYVTRPRRRTRAIALINPNKSVARAFRRDKTAVISFVLFSIRDVFHGALARSRRISHVSRPQTKRSCALSRAHNSTPPPAPHLPSFPRLLRVLFMRITRPTRRARARHVERFLCKTESFSCAAHDSLDHVIFAKITSAVLFLLPCRGEIFAAAQITVPGNVCGIY